MKKVLTLFLAALMICTCIVAVPFTTVAATTIETWSSGATEPEGSGTEADPYLIATVQDLLWVANQTNKSPGEARKLNNTFEGKYLKQTANIDLQGKAFPAMGGYIGTGYSYDGSGHKYSVFGGNYDGQGYSISNGYICNPNPGHTPGVNWPVGLFGIIRGATIENVVLDNINMVNSVNNKTAFCAGLLVGYALAETEIIVKEEDLTPDDDDPTLTEVSYYQAISANEYKSDYNQIKNCYVSGTMIADVASGHLTNSHWGGLVGVAYNTTIENCVADVDMILNKSVMNAGGFVGTASYNSVIKNSVNNGSIWITSAGMHTSECNYGGFVGHLTATAGTAGLSISGCINNGSFKSLQAGVTSGTGSVLYGGFIGNGAYITQIDGAYTVTDCYNMANDNYLAATGGSYLTRVGAMVGCAFAAAGATVGSIEMSDCYSVALTVQNAQNNYIKNTTGEGDTILYLERIDGTTPRKTSTGAYAIMAENCAVATADEIKEMTPYQTTMTAVADVLANAENNSLAPKAVQPIGAGTLANPYLVESVDNLIWMAETIANDEDAIVNPFAGTYFVQVCDIDMKGLVFEGIGASYASAEAYKVFGGNYDGQGYTIFGGSIYNKAVEKTSGSGLFANILGATIQNVVLDEVHAGGSFAVGVLVGRALNDGETIDETVNNITNCVIGGECTVRSNYDITSAGYTANWGRIAGIAGTAFSTTIDKCVNNVSLTVEDDVAYAGGIVATGGQNLVIQNCANNAPIVVNPAQRTHTSECGFGGILGFIDPYSTSAVGDLLIKNCYNSANGDLLYNGTSFTGTLEWGGILGSRNELNIAHTYTIEGCYNLGTVGGTGTLGSSNTRVAGLIGSAWQANNAANENLGQSLWVIDCYSVNDACTITKYTDFGIAMVSPNKNSSQQISVRFEYEGEELTADADVIAKAVVDAEAEVLVDGIAAIDATIAAAKVADPAEVGNLGMQVSLTDASTVRFIAEIDALTWTQVGFDVLASYNDGTGVKYSSLNTVTSVYAFTDIIVDGESVEAPDGKYYILVVVENVPTDKGDVNFYLTPFVENEEGRTEALTQVITYSPAQ